MEAVEEDPLANVLCIKCGKSLSDMLGSVSKSALERYVASNPDFTGRDTEAVAAAADVGGKVCRPRRGLQLCIEEQFTRGGAVNASSFVIASSVYTKTHKRLNCNRHLKRSKRRNSFHAH